MPSLPELEVYKRQFSPEIIDQPIIQVESLDFRVVRADAQALEHFLIGSVIASIDRYGKWLIFGVHKSSESYAPSARRTSNQPDQPANKLDQLIIHLGLTGKLRLMGPEAKLPKYSAFVIHFGDGRRFVMSDQRHLGKVYIRNFDKLKAEKSLGPDLLDIKEDYFTATLAGKNRAVRDVLMDQKIIAGIGGKYADEILWQAKIHPSTKLTLLSPAELSQLYHLTRTVVDSAIALDADVERFSADWLISHRHTDQVCPRCHGILTESSIGGSAAIYCPHCQLIRT